MISELVHKASFVSKLMILIILKQLDQPAFFCLLSQKEANYGAFSKIATFLTANNFFSP